jgi:hypothetical protein
LRGGVVVTERARWSWQVLKTLERANAATIGGQGRDPQGDTDIRHDRHSPLVTWRLMGTPDPAPLL